MLQQKNFPTIFHKDNLTFVNHSIGLLNYSNDSVVIPFVAAEDQLFFGRYKPFRAMYVEVKVPDTNNRTMVVEYFDETAAGFLPVTNLLDETDGFQRSGFIHFNNPNDPDTRRWDSNIVNTVTQFWLRITFDGDLNPLTEIQGWNIVFSDDNDLQSKHPKALRYLPKGVTTGIEFHQGARDEILTKMKIDARFKVKLGKLQNNAQFDHLDAWDFLDISEINEWATFEALSQLFAVAASVPDDNETALSKKYKGKASNAAKVFYLSIDTDDDGQEDREEQLSDDNASGLMLRR